MGEDPRLTRRFAVVGSPIAHSLSPVMHRAAYAELGLADAEYERAEVAAGGLVGFLEGAGAHLGGVSVTMPLKAEAHALAAEHDAVSSRLGTSNTLIRCAGGGWRAENHDVAGIVRSLEDHGVRAGGAIRGAGILGSGATALSAVAAVAEIGVGQIVLSARSAAKAEALAATAREWGLDAAVIPWARRLDVLDAEIAVSALAVSGASEVADELRAASASVRVPRVLLDVLYHPWPAPLAAAAAARGSEIASGLEMLAHQAALQVRSMLGVDTPGAGSVPSAPLLAAAQAELVSRHQSPAPVKPS